MIYQKTKHLHSTTIDNGQIRVVLTYNLNTDHCGIGNVFSNNKIYRDSHKEERKAYQEIHKDKLNAQSKLYNELHKDKLSTQNKAWYKTHKNERKLYNKIYKESHRDPNTTRIGSLEFRIKQSCVKQEISIKDFDGFYNRSRPYLTPIPQCIKLNKRFKGSEGHHIMKRVVVFIPKNIHKSIKHNFKSGKNMSEINRLAWNYLLHLDVKL